MNKKLRPFIHMIMLSGILILVVGVYFINIKAGLPYQDPTAEMTIQWMAYNRVGETCVRYGISTFVLGLVGKIIYEFVKRRK